MNKPVMPPPIQLYMQHVRHDSAKERWGTRRGAGTYGRCAASALASSRFMSHAARAYIAVHTGTVIKEDARQGC